MAQGLVLPGWAISLLDELGFTWPDADEVRMFEIGRLSQGFQGELDKQLIILVEAIAEAMAAAPETFGASPLIIPLVKYTIGLIIDQLIDLALGVLVG